MLRKTILLVALFLLFAAPAQARHQPPRASTILGSVGGGVWVCPDFHPPARGTIVSWSICAHRFDATVTG